MILLLAIFLTLGSAMGNPFRLQEKSPVGEGAVLSSASP